MIGYNEMLLHKSIIFFSALCLIQIFSNHKSIIYTNRDA